MPDDFPLRPLGSVAQVRSGYAFKSSDMGDAGAPIIKIKNVNPPTVDTIDCERIPPAVIDTIPGADRYELLEGDILIAMTGATVGKVGRFPRVNERYYLNQRVGKVYLTKPSEADYSFLYYVLSQDMYVNQIFGVADGSAQANVSGGQIERFEIPIPQLKEQQAIARILGALDDKIALNRRMIRTLESIARAIFKSWFVDFDPVRANAAGQTPSDLNPKLAALFPDAFENSDLGGIPKGWRLESLRNLLTTVKGRSYKSSELIDSDTALVTLKSFARGGGYRNDGLKSFAGTYNPEQIVAPGEVVVACTDVTQAAEVIGRTAIVRENRKYTTLVASLDTVILRPKDSRVTNSFIYYLGRTDAFSDHTYAHSTGTTVLHLSKDAVPSFEFTLPTSSVIRAFDKVAAPVLTKTQEAELESETLAALRDALLPKLISGELRVPDAELIVGRAL